MPANAVGPDSHKRKVLTTSRPQENIDWTTTKTCPKVPGAFLPNHHEDQITFYWSSRYSNKTWGQSPWPPINPLSLADGFCSLLFYYTSTFVVILQQISEGCSCVCVFLNIILLSFSFFFSFFKGGGRGELGRGLGGWGGERGVWGRISKPGS